MAQKERPATARPKEAPRPPPRPEPARPAPPPPAYARAAPTPTPAPAGGRRAAPRSVDMGDPEHRGFPRRPLKLRFTLRRGPSEAPTFSAHLSSENVSMSGAFLTSSFFLPVGTQLEVSFNLPEEEEPVLARAELVRHQDARGNLTAGFGLHFVEFYDQTEVALARLFLDVRLRAFANTYLASARARALDGELERVADALAAWELAKVTSGEDPWEG